MSRKAVRVRSSALFFLPICRKIGEVENVVFLNHLPLDTTHTRSSLVSGAAEAR